MSDAVLVSIVVPLYNEAQGIAGLAEALSQLQTNRLGDSFEFVLVDDGSTDATWSLLEQWADEEPRATLVRLAGNRGSHRAVRAGLEVAFGEVMVMMPADLQEGLDLVQECLNKWHATGTMAVMMVPKKGRAYSRAMDSIAASTFYALLGLSTTLYGEVPIRAQVKLMDRTCVNAFVQEASPYAIRLPFVLQQHFPYELVFYDVKPRKCGKSKWTFGKKLALMRDLLVDTSSWLLSPWRIAAVGLLIYTVLMVTSVVCTQPAAAILDLLGGITFAVTSLIVLSILGVLIGRLHVELRARPSYVVREIRRARILNDTHRQRVDHGFDMAGRGPTDGCPAAAGEVNENDRSAP